MPGSLGERCGVAYFLRISTSGVALDPLIQPTGAAPTFSAASMQRWDRTSSESERRIISFALAISRAVFLDCSAARVLATSLCSWSILRCVSSS